MKTKKLWGGRFTRPTQKIIEDFTHSMPGDQRLAPYDLLGSIAHARMLGKTQILRKADSQRLAQALRGMLKEYRQGRLSLDPSAEDIHTAIQQALEKRVGPVAGVLHTARSRNDQVVTSLKLYVKEKLLRLGEKVLRLQKEILLEAERARGLIMPGFTHLRHAQPILVAHLLLSYLTQLQRDRQRLFETYHRIDELPLGSGALTGTNLPIDRFAVARELGFSRVAENSVDAVTSRDFVAEILADVSLLSIHLSRIAEDLILWSTREFGFLQFDESLLTGSSMMPQKQNPDFLELIRSGASRVTGSLTGILTLLKGLPTGYQRDLQGDKELLFNSIDRVEGMLSVLSCGFRGIRWNRENLLSQLSDESLYATDLAEYLVRKGVPFPQAHRAVGRLFAFIARRGVRIQALPLKELRRFSPAFDEKVYRLLDPTLSVSSKRSYGSSQPAQVARSIRRWKARL